MIRDTAPEIQKTPRDLRVEPNLLDYQSSRANFSWDKVRAELAGTRNGLCNIAYEAVDRHVGGPDEGRIALRFLARGDPAAPHAVRELTFGDLARSTRKFTTVLRELGVGKGDPVFVMTGRIPEFYIATLGALRNGSLVSPLFSAFGPEPVATRMTIGRAKVLVTTESLYVRKIAPVRDRLEDLEHVLLVAATSAPTDIPGTSDLGTLMDEASDNAEIEPTGPDDVALLHFTSGTTGTPKGALHVHDAVTTHFATGLYALDLHRDDIFWCTADPGWVTGMSYGLIAPLIHGVTSIVDEADFDPERWYRILDDHEVTVWYTAPTAVRMLMKAGDVPRGSRVFPRLRFIASVGEPLNPEAVWWGKQVFDLPVHDNWWQTETGGIMIANTAAFSIRPGSMGRPLPGIDAYLVRRGPGGQIAVLESPEAAGELALRVGWPSMFRGYLDQEERYRKCFADGLYLTGDIARRDADGYYWFEGRSDDVIESAGHLIGPFEVERALLECEPVAEAAAVGMPDATVGEVVKAFVTLKTNTEPTESVRTQLMAHARRVLGPAVAPREIAFVDELPHTRSGKIMRRLLKARELGLPEGDISALETTPTSSDGGSTATSTTGSAP